MSIHQFLFKFIQILFNLSPTVVFNKWTIPWCFWPFTHSKIFVFAFNIKNGCFNNHFLVFDIVKAFELMFSWLLKNYIIDCIRRENFCMYQFDVWKWKLNSYRQFMETKSRKVSKILYPLSATYDDTVLSPYVTSQVTKILYLTTCCPYGSNAPQKLWVSADRPRWTIKNHKT